MIDFNNLTEEQQRRLEKLLGLNSATIARLEQVAKQDERMEWMWGSMRRLASWAVIVLGAIALFFEQIKSAVKAMAGN